MTPNIQQGSICLLLMASLVGRSASASAPSAADEFDLVYEQSQAVAKVTEARLGLEQWYLKQLTILRSNGHAAWLEVARQQTVVASLQAQHDAQHKFAKSVESVCRRTKQMRISQGSSDSPGTGQHPVIKLSLPGSVRLIGWIELQHASPELLAIYLNNVRTSLDAIGADDDVNASIEKLTSCEKLVRGLEAISKRQPDSHDWQRARLDLGVARAELELARVTQRRQQVEVVRLQQLTELVQGVSADEQQRSLRSALLATADTPHITLRSGLALCAATLRLVASEKSQSGELEAARVAFRRLSERKEMIDELHEQGFASKAEVAAAQESMLAAKSNLDRWRERQASLETYCQSLLRSAEHETTPLAFQKSKSTPLDHVWKIDSLPASFFLHQEAVQYLLDLRRENSRAEARHGALLAELQQCEAVVARLQAAEKKSTNSVSKFDSLPDPWQVSLAERRQKERGNARLELEFKRAQRLAAEERLAAMRLEENRFLHQMMLQPDEADQDQPAPTHTLVSTSLAEGDWTVQPLTRSHPRSYVESRTLLEQAGLCDPAWLDGMPLTEPVQLQRRQLLRQLVFFRPDSVRDRTSPRDRFCNPLPLTVTGCRSIGLHSSPLSCLDCRSPSLRTPAFQTLLPRYSDYYAFGIRKSAFGTTRSTSGSATSTGGPWYYPGASTNFR